MLFADAFGLPLLWIAFCQESVEGFSFLRTLHAESRRRSFATGSSIPPPSIFFSRRPPLAQSWGGRREKKMRHPHAAIVIVSVGLARLLLVAVSKAGAFALHSLLFVTDPSRARITSCWLRFKRSVGLIGSGPI
jgi:hypothetical protein